MAQNKNTSHILQACLGNGCDLINLVQYSDDSVVSKTILDKSAGSITLFAFDKGQKLSEHTSPYDAVIQVLDGCANITIDGKNNEVPAGQIIIMPANIPHAVIANEKFKMLLIMIRTKVS